jgi:hypothetical protein
MVAIKDEPPQDTKGRRGDQNDLWFTTAILCVENFFLNHTHLSMATIQPTLN